VHLNGWTIWELVFLYCLWLLGHSLYSLFFWHLNDMEEYLLQGTFDQFLLRPASPFVQFIGREVQYMGMADVLIGVTGVSLAYANLGLSWAADRWVFFLLAIVAGTMIEVTLALMIACIAFWTGRSRGAFFVMIRFNTLVQQYPIDIFGYWFRVIVTGFLPVAFMNYYPTLMLLDKLDRSSPAWWLSYISPVVALLLAGVASGIWRLALSRYASSGS
jgi:ABC-2 type transport system permease protein